MISKLLVNGARPPHPTSRRLPIGIDEETAEEGKIAIKFTCAFTGNPDALSLDKVQHRVARRWVEAIYEPSSVDVIEYVSVNHKVAITSESTPGTCGVGEEVGASDGHSELPGAGAVGSPFVGVDVGELDVVAVAYLLTATLLGVETHVE